MSDFLDRIQKSLEVKGLKITRSRELIAKELIKQKQHLSAEDLLKAVRKKYPEMGLATVYRTLKLLQECGLVASHYFWNSQALFEIEPHPEDHHDHLICTRCHQIIEFTNPAIESLQESIAQKNGFKLTYHRMELYGLCKNCE